MHGRGRGRQPGEGEIVRIAAAGAAAAFAVATAGCGGASQDNGVAGNEVARDLARIEVRPGLWETNTEIVSVAQDGLPFEIAERMKGPRPALRHCITAEQAARPDANFLAARRTGRCRDEAFEMKGGRITGAMLCRDADGTESRIRTSGSYGPESFEARIELATPGIGAGRTMTLVTRQAGRRVGDCPEEEKETK